MPLRNFFRRQPWNFSEQSNRLSGLSQHSTTDNSKVWRNYWLMQKESQPWRTQPDISPKRQTELSKRRTTRPNIMQGIYPFKGMKLSRADIEWLLATHEDRRGPVDWNDASQQTRDGLDLRGADLRGVDLSGLPLARMQGGLSESQWANTSLEEREAATVYLERAYLREAHLEGADLGRARLKGADLGGAYLERAYLRVVRLEEANLADAHLEEANLSRAHLEQAHIRRARLEGANLSEAHLEGASLREAFLEGKSFQKGDEECLRILNPADLRGAYFDTATNLEGVRLGNKVHGFVPLADVRWGSANLAVIDWTQVKMLGDEYQAREMKKPDGTVKSKNERLNEYHAAVRANRQLAVVLRDQGLNEEASYFAYRAQVLQRQVLLQQVVQRQKLQIVPLLLVFVLLELLLQFAGLRLGLLLSPSLILSVSLPFHQLGISPLAIFPVMFMIVYLLLGYLFPKLPQLESQNLQENKLRLSLALIGLLIIALYLSLMSLLIILLFLVLLLPLVYLQSKFLSLQSLVFILSVCLIYLLLRKYASWIFRFLRSLKFFNAFVDYGKYALSFFLDLLAGYGYKPGRSLIAYLLIIIVFSIAYYSLGPLVHPPLTPLEAIVFSVASFHGRGFFPGNTISLADPLVILAAIEAIVGLIIEISFIATFTQRFFGK